MTDWELTEDEIMDIQSDAIEHEVWSGSRIARAAQARLVAWLEGECEEHWTQSLTIDDKGCRMKRRAMRLECEFCWQQVKRKSGID